MEYDQKYAPLRQFANSPLAKALLSRYTTSQASTTMPAKVSRAPHLSKSLKTGSVGR